jgi:hypothetical protein
MGHFNFSLERGLIPRYDLDIEMRPASSRLRYGDLWVYQDILRSTGFDKVLDNLMPQYRDTLHSLVAFKVIDSHVPYNEAFVWYDESFARLCYPKAAISSGSVSRFLELFGQEEIYRQFTSLYLSFINKDNHLSKMIDYPVLIDSAGLQNACKIDMTAASNHSGELKNEIRLIYVVDSDSGLPIFFKAIPGNIIDNTTLKTTVKLLKANNINIKLIIMDAGYSSKKNLAFLNSLEMPFLTRLSDNLKETKQIIFEHGENLVTDLTKMVRQNDRKIFCKQVPVTIDNIHYFAYLCLDTHSYASTLEHYMDGIEIEQVLEYEKEEYDKFNMSYTNKINRIGRFVLISNTNYDPREVIAKYYTRQRIEQIFDVSKNNAGLLPLRVHNEETLRGHILMSFIVTIIDLLISIKLKNTKLNSSNVFYRMKGLYINTFREIYVINEPTKIQNDIIEILNLKTKYEIENRNSNNNKPVPVSDKHKVGRKPGTLGRPKVTRKIDDLYGTDGDNSEMSDPLEPQRNSSPQAQRQKGTPYGQQKQEQPQGELTD